MSTLPRLLQVQLTNFSHYVLVSDDEDRDRVIDKLTNSQAVPFRWRYLELELSNDVLRKIIKTAQVITSLSDSSYKESARLLRD